MSVKIHFLIMYLPQTYFPFCVYTDSKSYYT